MTFRAPLKAPILLAAVLGLAGCAGAATHFFTLDPTAPAGAPASAYAGPPVRVEVVHIPAVLDRPELVREGARGRMTVSDANHWAGPLGEMMRRTLTQDLVARLPNGAVIFPDSPKPPGAGGVVVDVLDVAEDGGSAVMDVSWTIIPGHIAPPPSSSPPPPPAPGVRRTERLSAAAGGGGVTANAAEISALLGQLADRIAADLASR